MQPLSGNQRPHLLTARKGRKVAKHVFLYCACHGKCIFADPLRMSHACHRFQVEMLQNTQFCSLLTRCTIPCACLANRSKSGSVHGVLCTFWLRNVLRHLNFQTCSAHTTFWLGNVASLALFRQSQLSKKCTPLWREEWCVLYIKTPGVRTTFGNVLRRSREVKTHHGVLNYTTLHYTPLTLHYTPHTTTTTQLHNCTPLHSTTLHYTKLHSTTLHYTTLHYITLHYSPLHYTTTTQLHSTTLHYTKLHYTTLHYTFHYTTLHYTTLPSTTLHYNYNYTTLHYTPLH